jgi:hypothetical protein
MKKLHLKFCLFLTIGLSFALFYSCSKNDDSDDNITDSPYVGIWTSDEQLFDDPYAENAVSLPQGYLKVEINKDGTFTFYRKVKVNSHYPSTDGTTIEASLKGSYKNEKFTISDVCNDDDGKWYGSVVAALDEANGGDDDKIEDASGINGFFSPTFIVSITNNKLIINGIKFTKL